MKKILLLTVITIGLMITTPAFATSDQPLPDLTAENTSGYSATFHGSTGVQELWLSYETDLSETDPGYILGVFENFNLTPYRSYFWGRMRGDIEDGTPGQSDDFILGIEFLITEVSDNSILYAAEENVVFTTSFKIDRMYTGVGLRWANETIMVDGSGWYDLDENYRFCVTASYNPYANLYFEPSAWIMIDNTDDTWAWWRMAARYQMSEDIDLIGYYEDSTRSNEQFMIGLGHSF